MTTLGLDCDELRFSAERLGDPKWETGIPIRAELPDGTIGRGDIGMLDQLSLRRWLRSEGSWLRSEGSENARAVYVVCRLLGYGPIFDLARMSGTEDVSVDGVIDKARLLAWLRADGRKNRLAEDTVGVLLGLGPLHDVPVTESPDVAATFVDRVFANARGAPPQGEPANVVSIREPAARRIADMLMLTADQARELQSIGPVRHDPETAARAFVLVAEREEGHPLSGADVRAAAEFYAQIAEAFERIAEERGAEGHWPTRDELLRKANKYAYFGMTEQLYRLRALRGSLSSKIESAFASDLEDLWHHLGPEERAEAEELVERLKREARGEGPR